MYLPGTPDGGGPMGSARDSSLSGPEAARQPDAPATVHASAPRLGHRANPSLLQRVVKAAAAATEIAKHATCHTLRHSGVYPAFVRGDASPGTRVRPVCVHRTGRHPDHTGAAWSSRRQDHHGLHPCSDPGRTGRPQPGRLPGGTPGRGGDRRKPDKTPMKLEKAAEPVDITHLN